MAKDLYSIKSFHGGINNRASERDIEDNQFPDIDSLDVSTIGSAKTAGSFSERTLEGSSTSHTIKHAQKGFGYHTFKSDSRMNASAGSTEYIVVADYNPSGTTTTGGTGQFLIRENYYNASGERVTGTDEPGPLSIYGGVAGAGYLKPVYYYSDGGLRISPGTEITGAEVHKYQLLQHQQMSRQVTGDWYWLNPTLTPPAVSGSAVSQAGYATGITGSSGEASGESGSAFMDPSGPWGDDALTYPGDAIGAGSDNAPRVFWTTSNARTGYLPEGQYEFSSSWVYDGGQESLLTRIGSMSGDESNDNIMAGQVLLICATFKSKGAASGYGANGVGAESINIIGSRIYIRRKGHDYDPWHLCMDVNFGLGARQSMIDNWGGGLDIDSTGEGSLQYVSGEVDNWHTDAQGDVNQYSFFHTITKLSPLTYEAINGFRNGLERISFGKNGTYYKCGTVIGRRAFVANVKYADNNGSVKLLEDRILYTPPNKFDTFPESFHLDIGADDGEAFTALEGHSGMLFAFKETNLYIVNVQSGTPAGWALLGKFNYMGVKGQAAVEKTELGVAWANNKGCFVSGGKGVTELTKSISNSLWATFIGDTTPDVGFNPITKQIVVTGTESNWNYSYVFDTGTGSWTYVENGINYDITGGFTETPMNSQIFNDKLSIASNYGSHPTGDASFTYIDSWSDTVSAGKEFSIKTKDMDMGNPSLKKKIYGAYVTLKNNNADISGFTVQSAVDGGSLTGYTGQFLDNADATGGFDETITGSTEVIHKEYLFATPKLVQSVSFKFSGAGDIIFDDISIEYRPTRKRIG